MELSGVEAIQARISEIQRRFGIEGSVPGMASNFQRTLTAELKKKEEAVPAQKTAAGTAAKTEAGGGHAKTPGGASAGRFRGADETTPLHPGGGGKGAGAAQATSHVGASAELSGASNETAHFIREAAAKYGLDSRLVAAVAEAESNGNQSEVSDAGAVGVMQLMPDTAAALGVNPYDEKQNIEGGAHYLKQMLDAFGGDMKKAIAAYNAGPQAVKDYDGVPPYAETQNYVNKVLDLYQ